MTTLVTAPPAGSGRGAQTPLHGRAGRALLVAALVGCAAGVVAGLVGGPLWLDEALSVEIARRPVPDLLRALRQDGAPPLYYLLLHGWMAAFGTSTLAVRLLTVLLLPVALGLAWLLGTRLRGPEAGRAAVIALAALPWTMRYASETRMYLLVVVLVLAGALALRAVRTAPSRGAVAGLGACVAGLLLTHYWSLFLLAIVAAWHAPGVLRRDPAALRVGAGFVLGGLLFLPWVPTFLFQMAHTGAPWASPPGVIALIQSPTSWGGGFFKLRVLLAVPLVALVLLAARRTGAGRALAGVSGATLLLAWLAAQFSGAYAGRYTAVVVPLVAVAAALGATSLRGRWPAVALGLLVAIGVGTGVPAAAAPRATADDIAEAFRAEAGPGDVLVYCPDQLGPPVARAIGPGYRQLVYPTLDGPELVDWVDYAERNEAADPTAVAADVDALAAGRRLFVLKASGYRTYEGDDGSSSRRDDCARLLWELSARRGAPAHLFGPRGTTDQQLFGFPAR